MNYKELKQKLLNSSEAFRREYLKKDLPFELAELIIRHRIKRGLTQEQLAKLVGTKQPGIARAEKGTALPTIALLSKIASALNLELLIDFRESSTQTFEEHLPNHEILVPLKMGVKSNSEEYLSSIQPNSSGQLVGV